MLLKEKAAQRAAFTVFIGTSPTDRNDRAYRHRPAQSNPAGSRSIYNRPPPSH